MPGHFCLKHQTPTTDRSEINLTFTVRHTHICQAQHGSICVGVGAWPRGVAQEAAQADSWGVVQVGRLLSRVFDTRVHTVKVLVLRRKPRRGWAETWPEWSLA